MKQHGLLAFLAFALAVPGFGGSFFTTAVFFTDGDSVIQDLKSQPGHAFVLTAKESPHLTVVADAASDTQSDKAADSLMSGVTGRLAVKGLFFLVHDSDILVVRGYENGRKVFDFDSRPGYFTGDDLPPSVSGLPWLAHFGLEESAATRLLSRENVDRYVFAEDLMAKVCQALSLPSWMVGVGYGYLHNESETREEIRSQGVDLREVPWSVTP
jgi:hypothetical protein